MHGRRSTSSCAAGGAALTEKSSSSLYDSRPRTSRSIRPSVLPFGTLKRIEIAPGAMAVEALTAAARRAARPADPRRGGRAGRSIIRSLWDRHRLTILLVEHHMRMVMGISDKVVVLDFGRKIAEGVSGRGAERSQGDRGLPRDAGLMALLQVSGLCAGYGQVRCCATSTSRSTTARWSVLLGANGELQATTLRALCQMIDTWGSVRFAGEELVGKRTGGWCGGDRPRAAGSGHVPRS